MQRSAALIVPIAGQILIRVSKGIRTFHPDFLALQRLFQFLKHAKLVVSAINPRLVFTLAQDFLAPFRCNDSVQGDFFSCWEMLGMQSNMTPDHFQRFNDRLKAIVTANLQCLQ